MEQFIEKEDKNNKNVVESSITFFEKVSKLTKDVKQSNVKIFQEKINIARNEAIEHIMINAPEKILLSANKGHSKCPIYIFNYEIDFNKSDNDSNGNKIIFNGNIHLSNLVTKGRSEFIENLRNVLNKDGGNFDISISQKKTNGNNTKYFIFAEW
jgi:hypothetical protein